MYLFKTYYLLAFLLVFLCCTDSKEFDCNKDLSFKDGLTYLDNKLFTGGCIGRFENGEIKSIQAYINGQDNGIWKFYFENGNIETDGRFLNGKKIGVWTYRYYNGNLKQISKYDSLGRKNGIWEFYDFKGKLLGKQEYIEDYLIVDKNSL